KVKGASFRSVFRVVFIGTKTVARARGPIKRYVTLNNNYYQTFLVSWAGPDLSVPAPTDTLISSMSDILSTPTLETSPTEQLLLLPYVNPLLERLGSDFFAGLPK